MKKIPFVVKSVLLSHNINEKNEIESWASKITCMKNNPPKFTLSLDLRCNRDSEVKNRIIRNLRLSADQILKILNNNREKYIEDMSIFLLKHFNPLNSSPFSCGGGVNSLFVDAYGNIQMCTMLRHPATICNIKSCSIEEALTDFFPKIRSLELSNLEYLNKCAKCFLKNLCDQCPAKSWVENGDLFTPSAYLCDLAHAKGKFLGLLNNNEKAWEVSNWEDRLNVLFKKF